MSLHDSKIRNVKPSANPFKVSDSYGLYLLVNPGGSRLWYLKYRINKKESRLGLGAYPVCLWLMLVNRERLNEPLPHEQNNHNPR